MIYHKGEFNPELAPPRFPNYKIIRFSFPFLWTQIRFAWEIWKIRPDVLWMPVQTVPVFRRKSQKIVAIINDLAFKYFPEHFTRKDLRKLNFSARLAVKNSTKIIAASLSSKKDILKFFPEIPEEKIKVIYHGFDAEFWQAPVSEEKISELTINHKLKTKNYLLYVGAIQPRKDIPTLVRAFNEIKKNHPSDWKLVIAGEKAWLWENTFAEIEKSPFRDDIVLTGKLTFEEIKIVFRESALFVLPALYEGFGIPVLEAFASGIPVICARNSSLIEVGGDAAEFFETGNHLDLAEKISSVLNDPDRQKAMIEKGKKHIQNFTWEKCARKTLEFLKS